jgi:hypothetical protein
MPFIIRKELSSHFVTDAPASRMDNTSKVRKEHIDPLIKVVGFFDIQSRLSTGND